MSFRKLPAAPLRRPEDLPENLRNLWLTLRYGGVLLIHRALLQALVMEPALVRVEIPYNDATQMLNVGYANALLRELQRERDGFYPGWNELNLPGDEYRVYIYP